MDRWAEVADGVFRRRYEPHAVNVGVVRGAHGMLVVDTGSSHRQADRIRADLRELGSAPVVAVVNTHAHFDHTFGNARFRPAADVAVPIYGHWRVPAHLDTFERTMLAAWVAADDALVEQWREVVITPPTVLVADDGASLDLGDRVVVLRHFGAAHTDND